MVRVAVDYAYLSQQSRPSTFPVVTHNASLVNLPIYLYLYGGPVGRRCHDMHILDLRTCTLRHVVATWQPRGNNCTSANRVCASLQIPDVHVCTSANRVCASPQIPVVHVCTSTNRVCARHDSCDLPGHRILVLSQTDGSEFILALAFTHT